MIYLTSFTLPSQESEENYLNKFYCTAPPPGVNYYNTLYPFTIFPEMGMAKVEFGDVTIFYGGNGSGKSTLLNIYLKESRPTAALPITPAFI